jgi:serine/threonine protein kinase
LFFVDIKPENFIMTPGGQLRIIDLGLSFRILPNQTSVLRPFAGGNILILFL